MTLPDRRVALQGVQVPKGQKSISRMRKHPVQNSEIPASPNGAKVFLFRRFAAF
jgi:hypothetical protein